MWRYSEARLCVLGSTYMTFYFVIWILHVGLARISASWRYLCIEDEAASEQQEISKPNEDGLSCGFLISRIGYVTYRKLHINDQICKPMQDVLWTGRVSYHDKDPGFWSWFADPPMNRVFSTVTDILVFKRLACSVPFLLVPANRNMYSTILLIWITCIIPTVRQHPREWESWRWFMFDCKKGCSPQCM